jgi:hypothetical protein
VDLKKKGLEGSHERFDHIERHVYLGERIENWIEMDGTGAKRKRQKKKRRISASGIKYC